MNDSSWIQGADGINLNQTTIKSLADQVVYGGLIDGCTSLEVEYWDRVAVKGQD